MKLHLPASARRMLVGLSILALGCGDDSPPVLPPPDAVLFYEPPGFCFAGNTTAKTLTLYNLGDDPLTWAPIRVPSGSTGLDTTLSVDPHSFVDLPWSWNPVGSYPILDSLVVETGDPLRAWVVIRVRREDPTGFTDTTPPPAPVLAFPADDAEFTLSAGTVQIALGWSEIDDCSGIGNYKVDIALTPDFADIVCCDSLLTVTSAEVIAGAGDVGVAYWRIRATDGAGNPGLPSEVRSWMIRP